MFFVLIVSYQYSQISFQRTYGTSNDDYGYSVSRTFDGGYIIGAPYNGKWSIIKTDAFGDTLWLKTYSFLPVSNSLTIGYQCTHSIIQTADSNYIMAGSLLDSNSFILKVDMNGDTLWLKKINHGFYPIVFRKVVEDANKDIVAIGSYETTGGSICCSPVLAKLRSNGTFIWSKNFICNATVGCRLLDILINKKNNYVISSEYIPGLGPPFPRVVETDTAGNIIWDKNYLNNASPYSIIQSPDSGYVFAGNDWSGNDSCMLMKIDKTGNWLWKKRYKGISPNIYWVGQSLDTISNGYILTGNNTAVGNSDVFAMKLDLNFNYLWAIIYGGIQNDENNQVISTADSGFAIIGNTKSFGNGLYDVFFIKGDKNGQITNLKELSPRVTMIYPNPSTNKITIQSQAEIGSVTICNSLGELVYKNKIQNQNFEIDISNLPSGIYILQSQGQHLRLIRE